MNQGYILKPEHRETTHVLYQMTAFRQSPTRDEEATCKRRIRNTARLPYRKSLRKPRVSRVFPEKACQEVCRDTCLVSRAPTLRVAPNQRRDTGSLLRHLPYNTERAHAGKGDAGSYTLISRSSFPNYNRLPRIRIDHSAGAEAS